jgi:hypothetical protein
LRLRQLRALRLSSQRRKRIRYQRIEQQLQIWLSEALIHFASHVAISDVQCEAGRDGAITKEVNDQNSDSDYEGSLDDNLNNEEGEAIGEMSVTALPNMKYSAKFDRLGGIHLTSC